MASGLCGIFGRHRDWTVSAASPLAVQHTNAAVRMRPPDAAARPFETKPLQRNSTFNTMRAVHCGDVSILVFATGSQMDLLSFVTLSELDDDGFPVARAAHDAVSSSRCLLLASRILNVESAGMSLWSREATLLVLTREYLYYIRVDMRRGDNPEVATLRQAARMPITKDVYSLSTIPHTHMSSAALLMRGSENSNDALHIWDPSTGLRLHSGCGSNYALEQERSDLFDLPLPSVQCSYHPQVVNLSWLNGLFRKDLRNASAHKIYDAKDSHIVNTSVPPHTTGASVNQPFGGMNDNYIFVSQSDREVLLVDIRHSNKPVASRAVPSFEHCMLRSFASSDFDTSNHIGPNESALFLGASRYSLNAYIHSVSLVERTHGALDEDTAKSVFYNSFTEFGAVGSLAWDVHMLPIRRHNSVSPIDTTEGLVGLELLPLSEVRHCSSHSDCIDIDPTPYNALICQQNALTGDVAVQRLFVGPSSQAGPRPSRGTSCASDDTAGLPAPPPSSDTTFEVALEDVCGEIKQVRGRGVSMSEFQNLQSYCEASIPVLLTKMNTGVTLTLFELYRFLWRRGLTAMKKRFQSAASSSEQGFMNAFRKTVIAEFVVKGYIVEYLLEESSFHDGDRRARLVNIGDGLTVREDHGAPPPPDNGCCTCSSSSALSYTHKDVRPNWKDWSIRAPCASAQCQYPYLLVYAVASSFKTPLLPAEEKNSGLYQASVAIDSTSASNKRSREEMRRQSGQPVSFATYSDISVGDIATFKLGWIV